MSTSTPTPDAPPAGGGTAAADNPLADVVSIEAAARAIGMSRVRLRKLCLAAGVAIRWGGSDDHPYLKVSLAKARDVVATWYEPPAGVKADPARPHRRPRRAAVAGAGGALHPRVRC